MIKDMTAAILSISKTLNKVSEAASPTPNARGYVVMAAPISIPFQGSLQPAKNKDLVNLPVGTVVMGKWKLYVPVSEIVLDYKEVVMSESKRMVVIDIDDWVDEGAYKKYILEEISVGTR